MRTLNIRTGIKAKSTTREPTDRLLKAIPAQIKSAALVIADLSEPSPNVYYELGYAEALSKPLIVTAKKGIKLPFDVADIPTFYWEGFVDLEAEIEGRIRSALPLSEATE